MRRTLISVFVTIIVIVAMVPAQASWVSEMLFGRHREYTAAGITYAVDEIVPATWVKDEALYVRYWKEGAPVFAGTHLRIGVLLTTGSEDGRRFAVCMTDPGRVVGNYSGEADFRSDLNRDKNGGLRILGTFVGKYGLCELNTTGMAPGTYFLYAYALNDRKAWKFSEQAVAIQIAPSLERMIPAMQDEPEEVLRAWGLESYPTLREVVGEMDSVPATFDVRFADGGKMTKVRMSGRPGKGRYLGVYTDGVLIGVVKVDSIDGNVVQTSSSSKFLAGLRGRERELRADWVVKVQIYTEKVINRPMTAAQYKNWMSFPDSSDSNSSVFGLRNAVKEMYDAGMVHLNEPYRKGMSVHYWQMYQGRVPEYTWSKAPEEEAYVPVAKAREVRCVRFSPSGIPVVKIEESKISRLDTQGLFGGIAYIVGQAVRRPDRVNVSANAPTTNTVSNINNNANSNTNVNANNNTVNVGDGSATGTATGIGDSSATSDP